MLSDRREMGSKCFLGLLAFRLDEHMGEVGLFFF